MGFIIQAFKQELELDLADFAGSLGLFREEFKRMFKKLEQELECEQISIEIMKVLVHTIKGNLLMIGEKELSSKFYILEDNLFSERKSDEFKTAFLRNKKSELIQDSCIFLEKLSYQASLEHQKETDSLGFYQRVINEIAEKNNKKINLIMKGEISCANQIRLGPFLDTLIHLIINAAEHGIETKSERRKKGKSETGIISLEIQEKGKEVLFTLFDDGRGFSTERPRAQSEFSGRGVGLRAVKEAVLSLKGDIGVSSSDKGTYFHINFD